MAGRNFCSLRSLHYVLGHVIVSFGSVPLLIDVDYYYYYYYYMVGKPKARGHRAYTQGVCSHICGAYNSLQPIMIINTHMF